MSRPRRRLLTHVRDSLGENAGHDDDLDSRPAGRLDGRRPRPRRVRSGRPRRHGGGSGKSSGRGAYRRYDWETGTLAPEEIHTVPRSGIVVVEGVYTARPELADHYDLLVYVDTPREESMRRLRARGHDHGPIDWESRWRLAEEHYLATTRPRERAHLVVPGY
ncbi:hypothetical protein ACFVYG_31345 [Streptomyces sp. NPDC058256]|uniref:hypothetical protein n=1 Tax=Streptomyces sp. NPDC058256 TaxID=3346408 RepID=UPI0036EF43FC